jgi:hypothetical protein
MFHYYQDINIILEFSRIQNNARMLELRYHRFFRFSDILNLPQAYQNLTYENILESDKMSGGISAIHASFLAHCPGGFRSKN